jgi:hypothetical protein
MAFDSDRGAVVLFGGTPSGAFNPRSDTVQFINGAWTTSAAVGPSARQGHAMAYDSARQVTVLFGGQSNSGETNPLGDTWEFNGTAWTQRATTGPSPRFFHSMAYDPTRHVTVLFGGTSDTGGFPSFTDTWEWNGTTWTQRAVSGAPARADAPLVYDPVRHVMVVFGGSGTFGTLGDTWEYNGSGAGSWTQRATSGPSPRTGHCMAYDALRGVTVLFGGYDGIGTFNSETWEWNGAAAAWTPRPVSGPPARTSAGMVYDSVRNVSVLFGGTTTDNINPLNDTWYLGIMSVITQQPVGVALREGVPASFTVAVLASSPTYQWRRNGVPLTNGGAISGATSPTLTISPTAITDAGAAFDCDVTGTLGVVRTNPAGLSVTPRCGSADFNGDGAIGTDADIEAFFRVLGGGSC